MQKQIVFSMGERQTERKKKKGNSRTTKNKESISGLPISIEAVFFVALVGPTYVVPLNRGNRQSLSRCGSKARARRTLSCTSLRRGGCFVLPHASLDEDIRGDDGYGDW